MKGSLKLTSKLDVLVLLKRALDNVLFSHEIVRERGTWETLLDIDQQVMRVPFSMHQLRCHCHQDDYPPSLLGRVAVVAWERAGKSLASL